MVTIVRHSARLTRRALTLALLLALLISVSTALAASDRKPPTTPTNLRVTGMTPYSVSLAWNPSTDNSGSLSYKICCANVSSETFPGPASSRTYRAGLEAGRTFTLRIVAFDAAGNFSGYSNSVTFTLPRDTTAPTRPVVTLTDVGATHVSLAWSSTDNGPNVWYTIFKDGVAVITVTRDTAGTIGQLSPETTYTFTVQAQDFARNWSPVSEAVVVTTEPINSDDTSAPTTPANLTAFDGGCEIWLTWSHASDNEDPQGALRYDVYLNGTLDQSLTGGTQTIVYPLVGGLNTFEVIAVDSAGNASAPAGTTLDLSHCF